MPRYRKKSVVVEAFQWLGGQVEGFGYTKLGDREHLVIITLEGDMLADVGDYIITGIKGLKYLIKEPIFLETYERVGDDMPTYAERSELDGS